MTDYHINDEGNAGICRAKKKPCPFGGWETHYASALEAEKGYEKRMELLSLIYQGKSRKKHRENLLTNQSLNSSLKYDGEKPQWLYDLSEQSEELFNSSPEIIDTLTIDDKEYAVVWSKDSLHRKDFIAQKERGYNISSIHYMDMETGEIIGYVKVKYCDNNSLKRSFGDDEFSVYRSYQDRSGKEDIIAYEENQSGGKSWNYAPAPYDENTEPDKRIEAKKEIWKNIYKNLNELPKGFDYNRLDYMYVRNLKAEHAPNSEKELDEQIAYGKPHFEKSVELFNKSNSVPMIDYSLLNEDLQGKGIATSMYVYAARKLGEEGQVLSSATIQSDEAKALWQRMALNPKLNMTVMTTRFEDNLSSSNNERLVLDFRL